jgi:dihydroorotate dehydrogenase (NAD+) catalytic subunit
VPVIGCGGISTAQDAAEYMLAGASAVQVGTATFLQPNAMTDVIDGLARFCALHGLASVTELTGAMKREEADEDDVAWAEPVP